MDPFQKFETMSNSKVGAVVQRKGQKRTIVVKLENDIKKNKQEIKKAKKEVSK